MGAGRQLSPSPKGLGRRGDVILDGEGLAATHPLAARNVALHPILPGALHRRPHRADSLGSLRRLAAQCPRNGYFHVPLLPAPQAPQAAHLFARGRFALVVRERYQRAAALLASLSGSSERGAEMVSKRPPRNPERRR